MRCPSVDILEAAYGTAMKTKCSFAIFDTCQPVGLRAKQASTSIGPGVN